MHADPHPIPTKITHPDPAMRGTQRLLVAMSLADDPPFEPSAHLGDDALLARLVIELTEGS
jgi:hypothetical protein